ncbi:MAG: small, acid-soluble spore protein, alpha/beta type [bacterium]|jgi:hypothetical protein
MRRNDLFSRRKGFADNYVIPTAAPGLESLKMEVANELAFGQEAGIGAVNTGNYKQALERVKMEAAQELGLDSKVQSVGWGNMTARECGAIGGRIGGKIGGNMVRKLIQIAESNLQ